MKVSVPFMSSMMEAMECGAKNEYSQDEANRRCVSLLSQQNQDDGKNAHS